MLRSYNLDEIKPELFQTLRGATVERVQAAYIGAIETAPLDPSVLERIDD